MGEATRGAKKGVPWELINANDLVLTAESEEKVSKHLRDGDKEWKHEISK